MRRRVSSRTPRTPSLKSASSLTTSCGSRLISRSRISAWRTRLAIDCAGPSCMSRAIRIRSSSMIWKTWREVLRSRAVPVCGADDVLAARSSMLRYSWRSSSCSWWMSVRRAAVSRVLSSSEARSARVEETSRNWVSMSSAVKRSKFFSTWVQATSASSRRSRSWSRRSTASAWRASRRSATPSRSSIRLVMRNRMPEIADGLTGRPVSAATVMRTDARESLRGHDTGGL